MLWRTIRADAMSHIDRSQYSGRQAGIRALGKLLLTPAVQVVTLAPRVPFLPNAVPLGSASHPVSFY